MKQGFMGGGRGRGGGKLFDSHILLNFIIIKMTVTENRWHWFPISSSLLSEKGTREPESNSRAGPMNLTQELGSRMNIGRPNDCKGNGAEQLNASVWQAGRRKLERPARGEYSIVISL